MVFAVVQLALLLHTRSILACAAEEAVRVAAAYGGDTSRGEDRLRALVSRELPADAITSVAWVGTLDTLTLRVRSRLPLGPLVGPVLTTTASAYHEEW